MSKIEEDGSGFFARCDWQARDPRLVGIPGQIKKMYDEISDVSLFTYYPTPPTTASPGQDLSSRAKLKLYSQLRDKQTAFEGMTFLGELGETIRMLKRPLSGIRDGMGDYLRTVQKRAHRSSKSNLNRMVSGTWLEYVYGWAPLIGQIDEARDALERIHDRYETVYLRFSAEEKGDEVISLAPNTARITKGLCSFDKTSYKIKQTFVKYYGQVYSAAATTAKVKRSYWGVSLRDFVPTVWELIPYSFVVDYFSNTGKIISALNTYTGNVAWISSGVKSTEKAISLVTSVPTWDIRNLNMSSIKIHSKSFSPPNRFVLSASRVKRQPTTVPTVNPFVDFRLKVPGVGSTQWVNLTALVAQSRKTEGLLRTLLRR